MVDGDVSFSLSTLILGSPLYASSRPGAVDERQL